MPLERAQHDGLHQQPAAEHDQRAPGAGRGAAGARRRRRGVRRRARRRRAARAAARPPASARRRAGRTARTAAATRPGRRVRARTGAAARAGRRTESGSGSRSAASRTVRARRHGRRAGQRARSAAGDGALPRWRLSAAVADARAPARTTWSCRARRTALPTRPKPLYSNVRPSSVLFVELPTNGRLEAGVSSTKAIHENDTTTITSAGGEQLQHSPRRASRARTRGSRAAIPGHDQVARPASWC